MHVVYILYRGRLIIWLANYRYNIQHFSDDQHQCLFYPIADNYITLNMCYFGSNAEFNLQSNLLSSKCS